MARQVTHLQIAGIWIDVSISEQHGSSAEVTRHPIEDGADVTDHVRILPDTISIEGLVTNQPLEAPGSHSNDAVALESGSQLMTGDGQPIIEQRELGTTSTQITGEPMVPGYLGIVPGVSQINAILRSLGADLTPRRRFNMTTPRRSPQSVAYQSVALRFDRTFDRVRAVHDALRATFEARQPVQIVTALRIYESVVLVDLSIVRDASSSGALRFGASGQVIRIVKSQSAIVGKPEPTQPRALPAVSKGTQNTTPTSPTEVPPRSKSAFLQLMTSLGAISGSN
jgi:hypothetical protein